MLCFVTTQPTESCQTRNFACRTSFIKKDLKTTSGPLVQQWHHTTSMRGGDIGVAYIQVIIHMGGKSPHNLVDLYPHLDILLVYPHLGGNTTFTWKSRHYLWSTNQRNGCTQTSFLTTTQSSSQWIPRMGYCLGEKFARLLLVLCCWQTCFQTSWQFIFGKTHFVVL